MEDVLTQYVSAYDPENPLVCMDELNKQLVKDVSAPLPAKPGYPERIDYEYERNGTANIFLFTEPLAGERWADVTETRTRVDWAQQIRDLVDKRYPHAKKVRVVMDHLNTHTLGSLYTAFTPEEAKRIADKIEIHYTPKHGSWLNIAEIELSVLSRQCLNRRIPDQKTLRTEVASWQARRNARQCSVNWRFTTVDARIKLKHLYPALEG